MRTIILLLSFLVVVSLGLHAWTISKLGSIQDQLKDHQTIRSAPGAVNNNTLRNEAPDQAEGSTVTVSFGDAPIMGDPDAPVTLMEFSDYQCAFCRRFHNEILPDIKSEYIESGKVRYIYRNFPLRRHTLAIPAAVSASCAEEQGKFWEMNDFLFSNPANLEPEKAIAAAGRLGLDREEFKECITERKQKHEARINKDHEEGRKYGVTGTPSLFIGRTGDGDEMDAVYLRGLRSFNALKVQIDSLLEAE